MKASAKKTPLVRSVDQLKAATHKLSKVRGTLPPIELNVDATTEDAQISGTSYTSNTTGNPFQFAWANRFTLTAAQAPFSLQVVGSAFFTFTDGTGFEDGEQVGIVIGVDAAASGNPANAIVVSTGTGTLSLDGTTAIQLFQLQEPVIVSQGDIYIGFVDLTTDGDPTPLPIVLPENGGVSNDPRSYYKGTSTPPINDPQNLSTYSASTTLPDANGDPLQGNFFIRGFGDVAAAGTPVTGGGQTINSDLQPVANVTAVGSGPTTVSWDAPPSPSTPEVEPNNSAATAQPVPFNTIVDATIKFTDPGTDVGDGLAQDWFAFTVTTAGPISAEIVDDGGVDLDIYAYKKAGPFTSVASSAGDCGAKEAFTATLQPGDYVLAVLAFDNPGCPATANTPYSLRIIGPGGALLTGYNIYASSNPDFTPDASTFFGAVGPNTTALVVQESAPGTYYRVTAVYGDEQSSPSDAVSGSPCEGGPTFTTVKIKRNGAGTITLSGGTGDLTGVSLTINGVGFTKAPKVKASKHSVKQKGPLANGQTVSQACPTGCTITVMTDAGCSTAQEPQ